jgi:hypothetical protein
MIASRLSSMRDRQRLERRRFKSDTKRDGSSLAL